MNISVAGSNMDVGQNLTIYVQDKLTTQLKKYFSVIACDVVFTKRKNGFYARITINEGTGKGFDVKSDAKVESLRDISDQSVSFVKTKQAFDEALKKLKTRLRRYKRHLVNKVGQKKAIDQIEIDAFDVPKYVIDNSDLDFSVSTKSKSKKNTESKINIVNEKKVLIKKMNLEDAIMEKDFASLPALVFINQETGRFNVIYDRIDGDISLIDLQVAAV